MSTVNQRVGDFCMKYVRGLSGFALVSFLSFQSGVAMSKVPEQVPSTTSSAQTQPVIIAGNPFKIIRDAVRKTDEVKKILNGGMRIQVPSNSLPGNRQQRKPQPTDSMNQEEREYFNSLSSEERQVYEIIHKAKRDLRHQPIADFLGSGLGITPKGTTQTPQDLDREFQNAIRDSNNSTSSQPPVYDGSVAPGTRPGNRILQRILNKRSNETHEEWFLRIDPVLSHTPREERSAWKTTLSSVDNQAYNALVQKENEFRRQQMKEVGGALSDMIRRDLSCRWVSDAEGEQYVRVCDD
ncbi:MAG: hypothetical protein HC907_20035 [Richelia sp. SM1_7_0]|nr:hypothetical protein [Richelia sp. SM1_7_0]